MFIASREKFDFLT